MTIDKNIFRLNLAAMTLDDWLWRNKIRASHFAESIGISPGHLCNIMKGRRVPTKALRARINQMTGTRVTLTTKQTETAA